MIGRRGLQWSAFAMGSVGIGALNYWLRMRAHLLDYADPTESFLYYFSMTAWPQWIIAAIFGLANAARLARRRQRKAIPLIAIFAFSAVYGAVAFFGSEEWLILRWYMHQ